ncbi:MAG: hypothetical protein QOJ64_543 [Acidobacteriota bacterium]|jgi:glycosyltransferase involved in cell wall biosynthesis|nr:hypothetical protein [Acidobacteriota bacterium]
MNVLHLTNSFHQGGSERQAVQLARLLKQSGSCRVYLACLDRRGALLDEALSLGVEEIPEFPLTSFYDLNALKQMRRFADYIREHEIAVVQTHDFYSNVFGMAAAVRGRVAVRIASKRETGGMRTSVQKYVERQAYRLAHAVVVNSDAVGRQLIQDGVRASKVVTVYNGLDLNRVVADGTSSRDEKLASLGLPAGDHRFVTIVANLEHKVKDHATFLRAASRIHQAEPAAAFVLAGEGRLKDPLRAFATELGLEGNTFFIGRCDRIAALLAVSDVCVLSSTAEGFSNAILEYMAAARPVVATDVGGAREALTEGETGHLVAAGDDEALAAHVISLLRNPERARIMGEHGRQTVEEKFSCDAQLSTTMNLYRKLLERSRRSTFRPVEDVRQKGV